MEVKCSCQHCGQNIAFPTSKTGTVTACPHCGANTLLGLNQGISAAAASAAFARSTTTGSSPTLFRACFLIVLGVLGFLFFAFGFDTAVSTDAGRINNFGRIATQMGGFIFSSTCTLGGILLLILDRLERR